MVRAGLRGCRARVVGLRCRWLRGRVRGRRAGVLAQAVGTGGPSVAVLAGRGRSWRCLVGETAPFRFDGCCLPAGRRVDLGFAAAVHSLSGDRLCGEQRLTGFAVDGSRKFRDHGSAVFGDHERLTFGKSDLVGSLTCGNAPQRGPFRRIAPRSSTPTGITRRYPSEIHVSHQPTLGNPHS